LIRKILRIQKSRAAARDDVDSDMDEDDGQNADRSILLQSSPGDRIDASSNVRPHIRKPKTEPESQRNRVQSQQPRSPVVVDMMEDDEDDEDDDEEEDEEEDDDE
jgi:hypothetical protein